MENEICNNKTIMTKEEIKQLATKQLAKEHLIEEYFVKGNFYLGDEFVDRCILIAQQNKDE